MCNSQLFKPKKWNPKIATYHNFHNIFMGDVFYVQYSKKSFKLFKKAEYMKRNANERNAYSASLCSRE